MSEPRPAGGIITSYRYSSLFDNEALTRLFDGVDVVVHCAAKVHERRAQADIQAHMRVNFEGTASVVKAATACGVKRLIFASSIKALGEEQAALYDDRSEPLPLTPYGVSKLRAEELVERAPLQGLSLRFPLICGPGMGGNLLRLFRLVERGIPLPFGGLANRRTLLSVDNLTAGIATLLADQRPFSGRYLVSDSESVSTTRLLEMIGEALGRPARIFQMPHVVFRMMGISTNDGTLSSPASRVPAARKLFGSIALDSSRFWQRVGYPPPVDTMEGIRRAAAWYARQNHGSAGVLEG